MFMKDTRSYPKNNNFDFNKVFGIGMGRTATTSLYVALYHLGVHIKHHPDDPHTYEQLIRADYNLSILKNCDGACDLSIAPFYRELDREFPGSKFILTVRDIKSWLESTKRHWAVEDVDVFESKFSSYIKTVVFRCLVFNEQRFSDAYKDHQQGVVDYFKDRPDDLLVIDICGGEGWEPLCGFLNKKKPEIIFPHRNESKDQLKRISVL